MKKIYFYVGSNNKTHELEVDKIEQIVSKYFDGFSTFEIVGYWKGNKERTLKVEVVTEVDTTIVAKVAKDLKEQLQQDAIMVEVLDSNTMFI